VSGHISERGQRTVKQHVVLLNKCDTGTTRSLDEYIEAVGATIHEMTHPVRGQVPFVTGPYNKEIPFLENPSRRVGSPIQWFTDDRISIIIPG
jgi:hypothetical protein